MLEKTNDQLLKETAELLRLSEERYRLMVESVKDYAIFMLSPEGFVQTWNQGARYLKGYTAEEIIGKHFSIFYLQEANDRKYPQYELEQAVLHGSYVDEGLRLRKDGTTFYANVTITALFSGGKHVGFAKVTRDLTDRKKAEEQLRQSEERYRLFIEGVKDYAIFMLDPSGTVISWNEGAKRLKYYEEHEIIGKHFSIFYPEEKKQEKYPEYELEQAILHGKFEDEGIRLRKDGSSFYANVVITAIYSGLRLIGFSKITRDLTERKIAEEKLAAANKDLEKRVHDRTVELSQTIRELKTINADLDNFIYTASHDLKAPVANIEGLILTLGEVLADHNFVDQEIDSLLRMIHVSVQRFQNTIKDLAAVNESQKYRLEEYTSVNIKEIVDEVLASVEHLVKESKAQIVLELQANSPLRFSKIHMRSIVYNFLTNAIKYRSPQRPLEIRFRTYEADGFFCLEVADNGLGIKEESQSKVFQMFKRLHSHVEGSGIGLYIVKRIVENAGGSVTIHSEVDRSTTFKVAIPFEKTRSQELYESA